MNDFATAPVLASDNIDMLRQTIDVVRSLDERSYRAVGPWGPPSAIGGHVRHIHDHYRLLLDGLPDRRIDYEKRPRDPRIEQDQHGAIAKLEGLIPGLAALPEALADVMIDIQSACGLGDAQRWCRSTVQRELEYLVMHDVHHHALIAIMLHSLRVPTPDGFGVAPSTRRYLQGRPTCAP